MPFSSTPVYVGAGDTIQVRYPTPQTWNTQVTVNVQVGTGSDPDGITFGTKIPDALPNTFSFTDQAGFTGAFNGTSSSGAVNVFQRNTTYYSQVVDLADFEIPIPASISAISNGPKNNNTNNTTAQFRIYRGGAFDSWRTSITADVANGTGGLQPGDKVQLRVTFPDRSDTSTTVTYVVVDDTFGTDIGQSSTVLTRTWSITTRAQDQNINSYSFTDRVDQVIPADGGDDHFYQNVSIAGIDGDVVLRAVSTGNLQISADNTNWSQSIGAQLVLNDTLYTRILNGPGYTTKTTGTLNVYAVGGDTYTRSSNSYENTTAGTYGSGTYAVTQNLGTVTDNWQSWTEVDRYPDDIQAAPIFTYGVTLDVNQVGTAFNANTNYNVSSTSGSGGGMVVRIGNSFELYTIIDPGYGYAIGDTITINSPLGGDAVIYDIIEYQKVIVSTTTTNNVCEPSFMYFADIPVTGLGTEYTSGTYNDLEAPFTNLANNSPSTAQSLVATLNGTNVKIQAIIDGTAGLIRKNNTGSWVQQIIVEENDVINLKLPSSSSYNITQTAKVTIQGPTYGNPTIGNPTAGPSNPTYAWETTTMTLKTRASRTTPYPFHAEPVFLSNPGAEQIAQVEISGLDVAVNATIVSGVGTLSVDQINWGTTVSVQPSTTTLFVRQNASTASGGLKQLTYSIGTLSDTFRVYTQQFNAIGDFITEQYFGATFTNYVTFTMPAFATEDFYLTLVGAGGGDGGGEVPNSTGGPGGSGNLLRCRVQIPTSAWPLNQFNEPDYKLRIYPAGYGQNGASFATGSGGGAGGGGYTYGGDGGNAGPNDQSGAGGGGGGASAVTLTDGTLIALAGGGGGGAGAGNDTTIPAANAYGNHSGYGSLSTSTINLSLTGDDAPNATGEGGGPGGGGGGYDGAAGTLLTSKVDEFGGTIQTTDLDATGGNGGGSFYNTTYVSLVSSGTPAGLGAPRGAGGSIHIEYSQQDVTPDPFSFSEYDGATVQEEVLSQIIEITGITGAVPVQINTPGFSGAVRICTGPTSGTCGAWESGSSISNGQYLQLKATTGNQYFTTYQAAVTVGDTTNYWNINTGAPPDTEPASFFFANVNDATISTVVTSEVITISGITVPVDVVATNGAEVRIDGGSWVSGSTSPQIENGQTLEVRLTSSSDYEASVNTSVTVGTGDPVEWTITTAAEVDTTPDGFTWIYVTGADLLTEYESNTVLLKGLGGTADFIVESGTNDGGGGSAQLPQIKKNGTLLGPSVTQTTVNNFDTISLVYTTSGVVGETRIFNTKTGLATSTDGYYETLWSVITAGQFGTTPGAFAFSTAIATGTGVYTEATSGGSTQIVTITGLSNGVSVSLYGTNKIQFNINNGGYNTYSVSAPASVSNGDEFTVRLLSSEIAGFSRTGQIYAGSFNTSFSVQTPASIQDPIEGQWYSSITPCKYVGDVFTGQQIRFNTKFDGLPVGSMMPVFQDSTEDDSWGKLNGKADSRFPGWVYCDGDYYNPDDYPALYDTIGYSYGAKVVGSDTYFRVPDLRNRYVKGTGVIDGNSASSPGLSPTYQKTKQSGAPGNNQPGSFGGMWYVETIGVTDNVEAEQVEQPAIGQPAQESEFFGIAQVSTAGYTDISGTIEFETFGKVTCNIGLDSKGEKIYDVPLHFHDVVTGVADPGNFKGRVGWGQRGGYGIGVTAPGGDQLGEESTNYLSETTFSFNLWGYALDDYELTESDLPESYYCGDNVIWKQSGAGAITYFGPGVSPGYQGVETVAKYDSVNITQDGIGSTEYNEINSYIDLGGQPFSGNAGTFGDENVTKFLAAIDIPRKDITLKGYQPPDKLKHNHYVSLVAVDNDDIYGYGNNETGGTNSSGLASFSGGVNNKVDLEFSSEEIGIQVLPGTFTLSQSKQLIPVPSFSPQDNVPVVAPYVWTKWMIKAY